MLKKAWFIFIGSLFVSVGMNGFLVPNHLLDGGMIGIGLIIRYTLGVKVGLTIILLSIPIFILAWMYYRTYFYNSLHGLLVSSFFIDLLAPLQAVFHLPATVSSIIGGCLVGIGIGLMLRQRVSTGGTDLLAQFIAEKLSVNVGLIIFLIDGVVLLTGYEVIGVSILKSGLVVLSVGFMTTLLLYGSNVLEGSAPS